MALQHSPSLIIINIDIPNTNGINTLNKLRTDPRTSAIPVIMLTMVDDPARGFTLGAADYATKPVNRKRLSQILRKHLAANPSVLVIEDDPTVRNMTRSMLEREGWKVSEADNTASALASLERERPTLILLDLMIPEMDGFEFVGRLQNHPEWRSIPLVVVTDKDLSTEERLRLNGSVEAILHKTAGSRDTLLDQVRDVISDCAARGKCQAGTH